mmetsp:Transcript_13720/g.27767  ORF Transcript_13720/g.27767 Transcript_13720/m.27767 type:complete len:206 (+) Transcript_13720:185-802(+)
MEASSSRSRVWKRNARLDQAGFEELLREFKTRYMDPEFESIDRCGKMKLNGEANGCIFNLFLCEDEERVRRRREVHKWYVKLLRIYFQKAYDHVNRKLAHMERKEWTALWVRTRKKCQLAISRFEFIFYSLYVLRTPDEGGLNLHSQGRELLNEIFPKSSLALGKTLSREYDGGFSMLYPSIFKAIGYRSSSVAAVGQQRGEQER